MTQSASENYAGVWGNRIGFGKHPALLMVDFLQGYTTPGAPLFAPGVVAAVQEAQTLLEAARRYAIPVVHSQIRYHPQHQRDGGRWVQKAPVMRDMVEGHPLAAFCPEVLPLADEVVITKQYASVFFGTALAPLLVNEGIDTLIIAGCSTSGCVRASVVDALQYGFRAMVVRECVGDRHAAPHEANLFDIDSKYGDVVSKAAVLAYLGNLSAC